MNTFIICYTMSNFSLENTSKLLVIVIRYFKSFPLDGMDGFIVHIQYHGPLTRYIKLRVPHAPGMPGTFSPPLWVSDPDMHYGTCVMHVPWCMPASLTSGFLWCLWQGKRAQHSRRMRTRNFTYLARGPWLLSYHWPSYHIKSMG